MSLIFHFVDNQSTNVQTLQYIQAELYERLKEFSEQIKEDGVFLQSSLKILSQFVIEEVIVGNNYLVFRLQDGRVCRTTFTIKTEKITSKQERVQKRLSKGVVDKLVHFGGGNGSNPPRTNLGPGNDTPHAKGFVSNRSTESSQSLIGGANSVRNSLPHRIARYQMLSSTHSAPRVNFIREMQRQGIYFARTFNTPIAASEVPEDLIEQCQTVLQGKSRQLIIRELQRTNLDVNMAVNNLLSRDDEAEENGGASAPDDWEETDDLLSLLDHAENPLLEAAVTDSTLGIPEDIFPSIRLRRESLYSSMASDIESFADRRKRRRLDCQLRSSVDSLPRSFVDATYTPRSGTESPTFAPEEATKTETNTIKKNCLVLGSSLEFWKEKSNSPGKGKDLKFIKVSGMYSELVGVTVDNDLHQWRWCDPEPWCSTTADLSSSTILQSHSFWNSDQPNGCYYHPRIPSLNLLGEKIVKLDGCSSRATVLTASGKLATWVDETIAPIFQVLRNSDLNYTTQNLKIEHPMTQFNELKDENILDIHTSSLVSAVRCHSGNIYWWGVIPFKYRKSAMEKNRERNPKRSTKHDGQSSTRQNKKEVSNISPGSFVCMRNAPIFHAGAIGFIVVGGVPKVGTLLEDAWKIEDICRFSVKPVQSLVNERRNSMPNSAPSINPASFDPLTHAHMCPQMNTSFLYGLLGSGNSKAVNIGEGNQNSNDSMTAQCSSNSSLTYKTPSYWAEMPPPPSPASSTCSDQSGPVKISPGTFKRKKHSVSTSGDLISEVNTESRPPLHSTSGNRSSKLRSYDSDKPPIITSSNTEYEPLAGHKRSLTPEDKAGSSTPSTMNQQQQDEEEDWCLKDVIFLEDGRTQPVGVVLKVDGSIAAVKFLKDSERACVAVNCPYSPLTAVFGTNNQGCSEPVMNSNTPSSPDPISWLNDCRLLRKEELVVVKQPLVSRVPDVVQKYPKCITLESCLDSKVTSSSSNAGILAMALENELIHLLIRKNNSSKFIEYRLMSLGKKVISSHRLCTSASGFLGRAPEACLISGPLESDYCELKHGSIFNAERHRPIFVRDGNSTVYPMLFKETQSPKSEPILSPHWLDLPPVRCVDFGFVNVTTSNNNNAKASNNGSSNNTNSDNNKSPKNKTSRLLIGLLVLESQTLMHHILRADDKKVAGVLESLTIVGDQESFIQKIINEKLDGQRNILHVAVHMCQSILNVETEWKLASILSYRSRRSSSMATNVEDLSHRSNWSLEHSSNMSSLSYRRWIDMGRPMNENAIFNYSRPSDKQSTNVRFTVMSSATPSRNHYPVNEMNAGWLLPPVHLDEKEKRSNSYRIINILVNQPSMEGHLITLLSQKNADGQTPFMQAIAQRIYSVALFLFDCIFDLCNIQYVSVHNPKSELALGMLYPSAAYMVANKNPFTAVFDDSPLQMLCQNDGCSFTWTGPDHIRQDIFECRTCGLTESLCCCTECARVCHKGHDCHLKKTSPTAYCDCWEKCRCKALVVGDTVARQDLLKKLLQHTNLSTLPNRRREHILLFLVKTVDRQFREHKQSRNSSRRHATSVLNGRHGGMGTVPGFTLSHIAGSLEPHHPAFEPPMPEYGLEPSNFALIALDATLANWASIETLFLLGDKSDWISSVGKMGDKSKDTTGINPVTDDDAFLNYQSFSEQLDQFVFTLISKTPSSSVDILLKTLNQELQSEKAQFPLPPSGLKPASQTRVQRVASRLIRSVARVYVALQLQMAPDYNRKRQSNRLSNSGHVYSAQSRPLDVCKKIFENLLFISLSELPRIASDIIAPVRCGLLKPTTNFSHLYQIADAVKNLDQVFQTNHGDIDLNQEAGDLSVQSTTQLTPHANRARAPVPNSSSRSNLARRTSTIDLSSANTEPNVSHGSDSSNFPTSSNSNNNNSSGRSYRRRLHNDDDADGGSGVVPISIDSEIRNANSAPPARRRRQSTPISLSSRMNALIDEDEDQDGHSSGDDNWNCNREQRSNSEERQHSNQINSIYLEESDGDGNTIEGENDIDADVDMEVYDEDHDTDIVPETESDSDDSISSSICVTEYNSESVTVTEATATHSSGILAQTIVTSMSDVVRVKDERGLASDHSATIDHPIIEAVALRKSSGIYNNDVQEQAMIIGESHRGDDGIRYSVAGAIDPSRIITENISMETNDLAVTTVAPTEVLSGINNPPEWFSNQVDLDAISDDESDDESSQNTDDDDRDDLNESVTDLSQADLLHARVAPDTPAHPDPPGPSSGTRPSTQSTNCGLQTTQAQLARSFCCLIKLLAGLLNQMYYSREKAGGGGESASVGKEYDRVGLDVADYADPASVACSAAAVTLSQSEEEHILLECSQQLGPIWIWICQSMDFLESQVCFAMAHQRRQGTFKATPVLTFESVFGGTVPPSTASQTSLPSQPSSSSATGSSQTSTDCHRNDFLRYVVSMMRASSDEHGDQVPVSLCSVNYCHIAYLVDALLYLMRICFGMVTDKVCCDGVDPAGSPTVDDGASVDNLKTEPTLIQEEIEEEQEDLNSLRPTIGSECDDSILDEESSCPTLICNYSLSNPTLLKPPINHRRDCLQKVDTSEDSFFSRTDYPQGWVGLGAHPFQTTVAEALPLAHMPQLLQPPGPSDEVFGILRRFEVDPSSVSHTSGGRSNEGQLPLHMGFSSRWADRLLDNNIIFSGVPVGNLRTRWRYSLEFLSNTFEQSVGLEPDSILVNFTHFSLKETRFRKEMEKLRNQCRRDLSLVVNRDRNSIICDTVTQLNTEFSRRNSSNSSTPLICHRFKVKFNDEPGEGNGVARSFLTVFAEAILSEEPLSMNCILNKKPTTNVSSRGSIYSRNEHNYIRMSAISRISAPSSISTQSSIASMQSNNWQDDALSVLGLGYNPISSISRSYRPTMRIIPNSHAAQPSQSMTTTTTSTTSGSRSIIRSDLTSTAQRLISAIAIFASSAPATTDMSSSLAWGVSQPTPGAHLSSGVPTSPYSHYSVDTPIDNQPEMSYGQLSRSERAAMAVRVFPRPVASTGTPPPYPGLPQPGIDPVPPAQPMDGLDAVNLASGFAATLGNQAPVWVGSNWLPMGGGPPAASSLGAYRRLAPYSSSPASAGRYGEPPAPSYSVASSQQPPPSVNLYDMLRNKIAVGEVPGQAPPPAGLSLYEVLRARIPGDDPLVQQMAYNLALISGRSDLGGLLAQLAAKVLNINDVISNLMNSAAQMSRMVAPLPGDLAGTQTGTDRLQDTNQASDINVEVSILTFAIYLESLMTTSGTPPTPGAPKQSPEEAEALLYNQRTTSTKCPSLEPEQTPLFWQPGHTGFYAPRRVNITDNNFEFARNNVYRSVGRIIGLSLLMNETMPLKLSRHVLKYILGLPIGWHDFAFYNSQLYESLRKLIQVAVEAQAMGVAGTPQDPILEYNLNFTISPREEEGGVPQAGLTGGERKAAASGVINLIPNGEEVDVDSNNVFQYVKKYCITRMIAIVKVQLDQIKYGVYDVLPKNALNGLSPEDLRLLFNGTDDINIDVLTTYTSFLDETSVGVSNSQERVAKFKKWFWGVVKGFNAIQRQNLLYFWTSSPSLPASDQGFQPMPSITVRPADDVHLPTANTCISRLYIPLYSSKVILREKLLQAIETKSFGFV